MTAWLADEPGAAAWLLGVVLALAVRIAVVLARRRTRRMTWSGRWFEGSTAWPPRRGAGTGQMPPHRNPAAPQSDIDMGRGGAAGNR